jgi:hypothetical protein
MMRWADHVARMCTCKETGRECVVDICLAYDGDQWRALVNTVINLRVP